MTATLQDVGPFLALILVGFIPNEFWRMLAVVLTRGLDEQSEVMVWVRAVATAVVAGVVAQLTFNPPGALAQVPFPVRLASVVAALVGVILVRGSTLVGVLLGMAVLIGGQMIVGR